MGRVENLFGPREEWGKGDEMAAVRQRAVRQQGGGILRKGERKDIRSRDRAAPDKQRSKKGNGTPAVPCGKTGAREARKAGFNAGMQKGISGFVSIRCGGCGKVHNTCLRERRTIFNCKACGHPNKLESLKTMKVECPRCSFRGLYKTNREESPIVMECLNCSHPVQLRKGYRRGNYVTIRECSE